jgi:Txe/YoeB family toxin of Txe-Axe toxin-antitoxin module
MSDQSRTNSSDEHFIVYFVDAKQEIPSKKFLDELSPKIAAKFDVILEAVAKAPPKRFSGGGYWEKMKAPLSDLYEVRIDDGKAKKHHRLFCALDYDAQGAKTPYLVILDGRTKTYFSKMSRREYVKIAELRDRYFAENPRNTA